jgi:hypothetical protein
MTEDLKNEVKDTEDISLVYVHIPNELYMSSI